MWGGTLKQLAPYKTAEAVVERTDSGKIIGESALSITVVSCEGTLSLTQAVRSEPYLQEDFGDFEFYF